MKRVGGLFVHGDDTRRLVAARWGFRPFSSGGGRDRSWINARAETAWESPAFGRALRSRRCVIPADAFYEWDRTTKPRQPDAIGLAKPHGMLELAGTWAPIHGDLPTAAILTRTPNDLVAPIHDRMPVILDRALLDAWLDPASERPLLEAMLAPAPPEMLRIWPVSRALNRVEADGPELLRPVEAAPSLGLA